MARIVHVAPLPLIEIADAANEALLFEALSSLLSCCGNMFAFPCLRRPTLFDFIFFVLFWFHFFSCGASISRPSRLQFQDHAPRHPRRSFGRRQLLPTLRIRAGTSTPDPQPPAPFPVMTCCLQFTQEHEAERTVALLQPTLFGTFLSVSRARPRPSSQSSPAQGSWGLDDVEGDGMGVSSDDTWGS